MPSPGKKKSPAKAGLFLVDIRFYGNRTSLSAQSLLPAGTGEPQSKDRPGAYDAFCRQVAAHRAGKIPADRQAEPGSFVGCIEAPLNLDERLEHLVETVCGNSDPRVLDRDCHRGVFRVTTDPY